MTLPTLHVPGDKSISHRALMFAALASGESTLHGLLRSADVEATADTLRSLGCDVPALDSGDTISVRGVGLRGLHSPGRPIDCGNSGTTARLLLGILAAALPSRAAAQEEPPPRNASGVRSECTMPRPAVIQFTAPGRIATSLPRLSRCMISPSNR